MEWRQRTERLFRQLDGREARIARRSSTDWDSHPVILGLMLPRAGTTRKARRQGNPMIKAIPALLGLAVSLAIPQARAADDFPSRPVSLMMPYAAGGPGDTITRVIAGGMSKA